MADDLSLLLRLRGDNQQAKATLTDTRAAVAALRSSFGNDLKGMQGAAKSALSEIGENVNAFVGQRIPLIGGAFLRVTSNLRGLTDELKRGGPGTEKLASQIDSIAKSSGKTTTEVARFLTTFTRLEGQAARNDAAFKFFGGSVDLIGNKTAKLLPELEQAGTSLVGVTAATESTGAAMAGLAGPIGIAIAALAAEIVIVVSLTKEIYSLAKASAEYQGKLFDLSQQVGVSVETLSALEVVARTTGGSIEGLTQSLGIFQKHLEEAVEDRGSKAAATFRRLSVDAVDTETALRQTIAALARMPEGFRQTALALELFGRGGKAFLAIAKESKGDIDEVVKRLSGLGLVTAEQAELADQFNDQLVILDVQMRGLGTKAIPIILDAMRGLSKILEENRDLFRVLQGIIAAVALTITVPLRVAVGLIKNEFDKVQPVLKVTALLLGQIKTATEYISGHPVTFGSSAGVRPAATAAAQLDPVVEGLKGDIQELRQIQGQLDADVAKRQREATNALAQVQREFEAGKKTRQQLLEATVKSSREQAQAEIDALELQRTLKVGERALAIDKEEIQKQTELGNAILVIDAQVANKRAAQQRTEADLRAKARLEERQADLAHEQSRLEVLTNLGQQRIAIIEEEIRRELIDRQTGLLEIEKIENASLAARRGLLKRELALAGVGPDRQTVLDKIKVLETDRVALERQQSERRKQITREEFENKRQILISNLDALLQVEQIRGNARIATIETQAALQIKTEEQAAKDILAIRLGLIDSEIEATKAKQTATVGIVDPKARREAQSQLTNDLKILNAQREVLQAEGNRSIDAARREDIENERRYAEDLRQIKERTRDIENDSAQEVIRLLRLHFANRKDIIRAQRDLDIVDEEARHQRATQSIRRQSAEVDEQIRVLEVHLKALKIGTTVEIEEYERLIEELEKLRQKRDELKRQQDAEDERSRTRRRRVTDAAEKDTEEIDPFDKFKIGAEDIKKFAQDLEDTVVPLGQILSDTFNQVAQAIGSVVSNWVLLGETGPAVMRKILAQALANIAAEAAVNAIKELAVGFALLAVGDFAGAGHAFVSAGLWAAIGGVAALAGRSVAGDLFKPKTSTGGSGSGGSSSSRSGSGERDPIDLIRQRQQPELHIFLHAEPGAKFNQQVVRGVIDEIHSNGNMRTVIKKVAEA